MLVRARSHPRNLRNPRSIPGFQLGRPGSQWCTRAAASFAPRGAGEVGLRCNPSAEALGHFHAVPAGLPSVSSAPVFGAPLLLTQGGPTLSNLAFSNSSAATNPPPHRGEEGAGEGD